MLNPWFREVGIGIVSGVPRPLPPGGATYTAGLRGDPLDGQSLVHAPARPGCSPVRHGFASGLRWCTTMAARGPPSLFGRAEERQLLDRLLNDVRDGRSAVVVIRGEAGIGKTALLEYCRLGVGPHRRPRMGVESEMELAFAGLHQLCAPMLDRLERLPGPQRDALAMAFGLSSGTRRTGSSSALAVLSLLSEVAEERPLLCVIDDAQWLDHASAQTLAFVARRLLAESVAIVFAAREPGGELAATPAGAGGRRARRRRPRAAELGGAGSLDERVRDRIVAETRGNPLALLELPRGLTRRELAGGFGMPERAALRGRIEESFVRRLEPLPEDTQPCCWSRRPSRSAIRAAARAAERLGIARRGRRAAERTARVRRAGDVPASAGPLGGLPVRDRRRRRARTGRWRRRPTRVDPDRRAWHLRGRGRARRAGRRASSSARPAGRRPAAASPPRPRSSSAPSR